MDILHRWTYPLTPDNFSVEGDYYLHSVKNNYRGKGVSLDRTALLRSSVIIGNGTTVGENVSISNSVIGRNCEIGFFL
jgi:translation initiation factor eIF-2B subunit epsilon